MTNTKLITDTTADLPYDYLQEHDIGIVGLSYMVDGVTTISVSEPSDKAEVVAKNFYAKMRNGSTPTTALVNQQTYLDAFEAELVKGHDIFYMAFSSGLSGSYQNAAMASRELAEKYPERVIRVVDTRAASLGEGLLVYLTIEKHEQGASDEELEAFMLKTRDYIQHWFTVDDLVYLKRGGRISSAAAAIGGVLNIKPVLDVDEEGKLIPREKVQGRKRALKALVDKMDVHFAKDADAPVFLSHGDCFDDAMLVVNMIKQRFGIEVKIINYITPIIGAHSGPGTVALFFLGKDKKV